MNTRLSRHGISFPFFVAPMVGISHVAFRELVRGYVPRGTLPLLFTEMLSTRRLPSQHLDRVDELKTEPGEMGLVPQLLGNEECFIAPSIRRLLPLKPFAFDINMGCPVQQTLRHNWGVRLMGDKAYAANVVRLTKANSPLPVSVKLRAVSAEEGGIDYLLDFTKTIEMAGADWITLHARPKGQRHNGEADWSLVSHVARERAIPIIANGDIQTADDALHIVGELQIDGAMIARAATARPWILWQIAYRIGRCSEVPPLTLDEESREYFIALLRYIDLLERYFFDSASALKKLKFFVTLGAHWFLFGHEFSKCVMKAGSLVEARGAILTYREKNAHPMRPRVRFQ